MARYTEEQPDWKQKVVHQKDATAVILQAIEECGPIDVRLPLLADLLEQLLLLSERPRGKLSTHVDRECKELQLHNGGDQRLATLDYPHRPILSRVRCIGLFCLIEQPHTSRTHLAIIRLAYEELPLAITGGDPYS